MVVGKDLSVYENAVYRQFENNNGKVKLKARGENAIGRACNLAGIIANQIESAKIENVKITAEKFNERFVTAIEINLIKK